MHENPRLKNEYQTWILVALVFVIVSGILITVFKHDKIKPQTPHELVASAFKQMLSANEWQTRMVQKQPLVYHPAGSKSIVWQPLPQRQTPMQAQNQLDSKWIPLQ
jgi:hypothetical protein